MQSQTHATPKYCVMQGQNLPLSLFCRNHGSFDYLVRVNTKSTTEEQRMVRRLLNLVQVKLNPKSYLTR